MWINGYQTSNLAGWVSWAPFLLVSESSLIGWLDLIGDYAGDEFFVLDGRFLPCGQIRMPSYAELRYQGDSLCQVVLDDELLAIGQKDTPCFQILHAIHSLEKAILDLKRRECNFGIVFFDCESTCFISK